MVIVSGQVFRVDVQVMVGVQLPELAVDDVEVLVGEVVGDLVDVVLLLQQSQGLQEVASAQLHHGDATGPRTVHDVEYSLDHLRENDPRRFLTTRSELYPSEVHLKLHGFQKSSTMKIQEAKS